MKKVYEKLVKPKLRGSIPYVGKKLDFAKLSHVILNGPKGIGKTLMVYSYARKNKYKLLIAECSEETRYAQLIGHYGLDGSEGYFSLGILPTAIKYQNRGEKFILLLEELNALPPGSQKMLNSLLDLKQGITVKEIGKRYEYQDPMIVVGTQNPSVYGGAFELNEDLKSRFWIINMDYPSAKKEIKILQKIGLEDQNLVSALVNLAVQTRTTGFSYALSTRDLVEMGKATLNGFTIEEVLKLTAGKFENEDYQTYAERVRGTFGIDI